MAKYGRPIKFIAMIRQFHDGMLARVQDNGETSAAFPVSNGVKHGCVLALNLVSLMFSAMLTDAFKELNGGIRMRYRYHESPRKPYVEPSISINVQRVNLVDKFTYLGSTLFRTFVIDDEINTRLAKASAASGRLHKNEWDRGGVTTATEIKVYKAVVLTTVLYGCDSWMVYQRHARKINQFHSTSLRNLLGIKWQDKIPDTEVLTRANPPISILS